MKRTTKRKQKLFARLERFEPRICMASDLNDVSFPMEIAISMQETAYGDVANPFFDETGEGVKDDGGKGDGDIAPIDWLTPEKPSGDGFISYPPISKDPIDTFIGDTTPGDTDLGVADPGVADPDDADPDEDHPGEGQVVPPDLDEENSENGLPPLDNPEANQGGQNASSENHEGRSPANENKPTPTPQNPENHSPSRFAVDPQSLPSAKRSTWEMTSNIAESRLGPSAIHPSDRGPSFPSPLSSEMKRFSSVDIAVTTLQDASTEIGGIADTLTVLPSASNERSQSVPHQYFRSDSQVIAAFALLRESFSDQTVLHETADRTDRNLKQKAEDIAIDSRLQVPFHFRIAREGAAIWVSRIFGPETAQANLKASAALDTPSEAQPTDRNERAEAPKQGSLHRIVGFILAGALISVQEASRIFQNRNNQEKTLHRSLISTLKNSSNS